ncbi:MAG: CBS domain-containing protein [Bdellovibrionales bacterium]|nr:CBS domain-containing protein [Bdellovibrionales bacterium]
MSIQALCKTNVITADASASLKTISELMQGNHVGSVVITKLKGGRVVPAGIITDRDIALAIGSAKDVQNLSAKQIMLSHPITADVDDGIYEVIFKMREHGVKRLPVTQNDGSLYGIISTDDLFELMAEEISNLAKINVAQVKKESGIRMPALKNYYRTNGTDPYIVYS